MSFSFLPMPIPGMDKVVDMAMDAVGNVAGAVGLGDQYEAVTHIGDVVEDGIAEGVGGLVAGAGGLVVGGLEHQINIARAGADAIGFDGNIGLDDPGLLNPMNILNRSAQGMEMGENAVNWVQDQTGTNVEVNGTGDTIAHEVGKFVPSLLGTIGTGGASLAPKAAGWGGKLMQAFGLNTRIGQTVFATEVATSIGDAGSEVPEEGAEQLIETEQESEATMPNAEDEEYYVLTTRAEEIPVEAQEQEAVSDAPAVSGTGWFADNQETNTSASEHGESAPFIGIVPDRSPMATQLEASPDEAGSEQITSHTDSPTTSVAASMDGSGGGISGILSQIFGDSASGGGFDLGSLDFGEIIQGLLSSLGLNFGGAESADVPQNVADELTTGTQAATPSSSQTTDMNASTPPAYQTTEQPPMQVSGPAF